MNAASAIERPLAPEKSLVMRISQSILPVIALIVCAQLPLAAQDARGTILGRVTDQTAAVLVDARVECLNVNTGVRTTVNTNAAGDYIAPFLIPGTYTVTVDATGFKRYSRSGINVRMNDRITVNIEVEIGQNTESVDVVGTPSLLDTSTASMGQVMETRTLDDLPLRDGNVLMAATLTAGVIFQPESPSYVRPFDTSSPSSMAIDGTRPGSTAFSVDGTPNMQRTQVAYSPPPGMVEEFKIQGATYDASFGFMSGGGVNLSLKSGTNQLHGQMYYFNQNPALGANRFFFNRTGRDKLAFRLQRWGATASGPVSIPKLYEGRNRTFWMYGYEGIHSFDPMPQQETVPDAKQRVGDFSGLLALGSRYQIYDPYSIAPAAGGLFSRQPVPGNIIPQSKINPTAAKIAQVWDAPNDFAAATADGENNYMGGRNSRDSYFNHIGRIDHNLSDKQRFYIRANATRNLRPQHNRHNGAMGWTMFRKNRGAGFDHVYIFTPQFILNSRYSYTRFIEGYVPDSMGWDLAGLGFSDTFIRQIEQVDPRGVKLPLINVSGIVQLSGERSCCMQARHDDTHQFSTNATSLIGAHSVRFGADYRVYRENVWNLSNSAGNLEFGTTWTRGPFNTSSSAPIGQGMASFLYGLPTGGSFPIVDSYAEQAPAWAFFVQDDWKVSTKLTLSVGLRYELPLPLTERFNRSVRGFDFTASSPVEAQAKAKYAASPIPEVPVSQFQVKGGLTYAGANGQPRTLWNTDYRNIMPRFGFAYTATPNTVLRGGYGVFFEPIGIINTHVNSTGFSQNTGLVPSVDNGLHYTASITNPFPDGLLQPRRAAGGLATNLGQNVSFFNSDLRNPYVQRWQLAVQRGLPGQSIVEVSYVGNRAVRHRISRNLAALPNVYLSTSPERDQATINYLSAAVPNPFYPLLPGTSRASQTVARSVLLAPYPQFTGVTRDENQGYSWYHSMQARFERRFSAGFSARLSYTWSKLMEGRNYLNAGDPMPEEVVASQDRTHRLTTMWVYELPFGRGRRLANSAPRGVSLLISGWQVQGIYTAQSGEPLGFGNMIFRGDLNDVPLPESEKTVERWFNVDAGFERASGKQLASNVRIASSRFNGIRADGVNNWDLSVIKNNQITEDIRIQLRAESMNALNHPQFMVPNTSPTSSAFGQVTSEWATPRVIQVALKLFF